MKDREQLMEADKFRISFGWFGFNHDGWSERESEFFLPGRGDHGSVLLYLEFPGWCGVESWDWTVSVGDGEPLSYQVTSGYYSLLLPLCEGSETRIRFTASADFELSSNDRRRSYRVAGVALGPVCTEGLTQLQGIESVQLEKAPVGYEWVEAGVWEFVQRNLAYLSFSPIQEEPGCEKILWHGREVGRTGSIESLKGKFGEDCFIVASGPSISDVDFSLLKDKTLFAVNGAISLLNDYPLEISLYTATSPRFVLQRYQLLEKAVRSGANCLLTESGILSICHNDSSLVSKANLALLKPVKSEAAAETEECSLIKRLGNSSFSTNIGDGFCGGGTVIYPALQACFSLGFRRVFILGMDLNMEGSIAHFYENIKQSDYHPEEYRGILDRAYSEKILPSFRLLSKVISESGGAFSVYNLSEHSRLPESILPKITLQQALEMIE